jgi:DNA-directed RNA polymerase
VLAVILWAWDNNVEVEGLPSKEDEELPPFPIDGKENKESRNAWAKVASKIHRRNLSTRSKRMLTTKVIYLAEKFAGERIFLPCNVDFRGRVYYAPTFCNPMGNDLSRGLLQFWREEKVRNKEEARWLAIHGSNSYGNDKVSLTDREHWAYDNADMIKSIAIDPIGDLRWTEADAPFSFLAFCFEWRVFLEKGKLKTKIPVMMDATNNGLQLLSILTRCEYGCAATNVTPNDEDIPADIYTTARLRCESYMRDDAKKGHPFAQAWLDYGIDRNCLKRPTMTKAYGLTAYSCRQYVLDWFEDKIHGDDCPSPFCEKEYYKAVHYLSSNVWKAIEEILDLPKQCMDWFVEVAQIVSAEGRPLQWTTPSGFVVKQDYKKVKEKKINTWITGQALHVNFQESTDQLSVVKQKNGVSPNTIHSYDSALLHLVVCESNKLGLYDFCMIHDSFGTHSNKAQLLADTIRSEAVKMFTPDLLRDWLSQIKKQNPDLEFPEPPQYGQADISLIAESPYFFS